MSYSGTSRSSNSSYSSGRIIQPLENHESESDDDSSVSEASETSSESDEKVEQSSNRSDGCSYPVVKNIEKNHASAILPADILNYMFTQFVFVRGVKFAASWLRSIAGLNKDFQVWAQGKINESREIGYSSTWHSIPKISMRSRGKRSELKALIADLVKKNAYVHANFRESKEIYCSRAIVKGLLRGPERTEIDLDMSRRYKSSLVDAFIDAKSADNSRIKALKKGFRDALKSHGRIVVNLKISIAGRNICDPKFFFEISGKNFSTIREMDFSRIDMKNLRGVTEIYRRPIFVSSKALAKTEKNFSCIFSLAKKSLDAGNLQYLNLSQTDMTGNHLENLVADFLTGAKHSLESLDLSVNFLGTSRPKFIKENSSRDFPVILYGSDSGVGAICQLLQSKNCPKTIDLSDCYFTDADADQLLESLNGSAEQPLSTLTSLYLRGNHISDNHPIWKDPRLKK